MELKQEFVLRETWLSRRLDPLGPLVTAIVVAILVATSSLAWFFPESIGAIMPVSQNAVFKSHEYWRLWSALFTHADPGHLLSNLFLFFILGSLLAGAYGKLLFPLVAILAGGLTNLIVVASYAPETQLVGVSGVVYWMGGAWLTLYVFVNRQKSFFQLLLRAIGVSLLLFMPSEAFDPVISYRAHFIGFLNGVLCAGIYFQIMKKEIRAAEVYEKMPEEQDEVEHYEKRIDYSI